MKIAATNDRSFRTFLLVAQLEAKAIGGRIRRARDEAGMTQEELADVAVGFSKRSLQAYEAGVTIPYKHMQEIAAITGKSVEWMLHGDQEPPSEEAPVQQSVLARLQDIEAQLAGLATGEDLQRGLDTLREAIDSRASQDTPRAERPGP